MANNIKCPCCSDSFVSAIKMKNHMAKMSDYKHKLLISFYTKYKLKCADIIDFYNKYQEVFDSDINTEEEMLQKQHIIIDTIEQEQKQKEDEQQRLTMEEYKKQMLLLKEQEELKRQELELNKAFWKSLPNEDKPKSLINYFYNKLKLQCTNYVIETKLVKGLYTKHCLSADEIRNIMDYMILMGKINLGSINYCINEAKMFYQFKNDINIPNTSAYFVKMYYQGLKMTCNKKIFVKEVQHIESTRKSENLSNEEVTNIIKGMIRDRVDVLFYFANSITKYRNVQDKTDNPCHTYTEDREVNDTIQEILKGNMSLEQVSSRLLMPCHNILKQKFLQGDFDNRYNHFEFAYKVKLNLTSDLYEIARSTNRPSRFEYLKSHLSDETKIHQLDLQINKFNEWLKNQPTKE